MRVMARCYWLAQALAGVQAKKTSVMVSWIGVLEIAGSAVCLLILKESEL